MATQIFVKRNGEYFAGYVDVMNAWIERTDYLIPDSWLLRNIFYKLFPPNEFHAIIAKGNKIHEIEGEW